MSSVAKSAVVTAATAKIVRGGKQIGLLKQISAQHGSQAEFFREIGYYYSRFILHNGYTGVTITASSAILRGEGGDAVFNNILEMGQVEAFNLEMQDDKTGIIWIAEGCEPSSQNMGLGAMQSATNGLTFMALRLRAKSRAGAGTSTAALTGA
jgi:hypothetical protein